MRSSFMPSCIFMCFFILLITGCSRCSVKEKLNSGGQKAGEVMGEVVHGVGTGLKNAFQVQLKLSDSLKNKGLSVGQIQLSGIDEGTDNLLSVYFIYSADVRVAITCRAFDNRGFEMGRIADTIAGKKGSAAFHDFIFDKRTNIDSDSKIVVE